jgi:hypothetical protein
MAFMVDSIPNVAKVWYQWGLNQGDTSKFDYNPQKKWDMGPHNYGLIYQFMNSHGPRLAVWLMARIGVTRRRN